MGGRALEPRLPRTDLVISWTARYNTDVCFVTSNVKSREKKQVLGISINESKITQREFLLPEGRHEDISKMSFFFFFRYFGMSSATFHQRVHHNVTARAQ
jgi:hypothetical protein